MNGNFMRMLTMLALATWMFPVHADAAAQSRGLFGFRQRASAPAVVPAGVREIRDLAYGSDPRQRYDVYVPDVRVRDAPVIFMVHGGGWRRGDKSMQRVVQNKVAHWVPEGFILVSVNYRLLPAARPLAQAADVAKALAAAQAKARDWGGDPDRFILMGHSAGAHLVSMLNADPRLAQASGARPWLGTVALDSAAYDVTAIMNARHFRLYDRAFGNDPAYWRAASPLLQLRHAGAPFLAVCSSRREDSCPQAQAFVSKATALGMRAQVLPEDLSHAEINGDLGLASPYTASVDAFMAGLDPQVAARIQKTSE